MNSEIIRNEVVIDWKSAFLSVVKRWWVLLLCFVLGAGAGYGLGVMADRPVYACNATYVLSYSGGQSVGEMSSEYGFLSKILYNCIEIAKQNTFVNMVADEINGDRTEESPDYIDPLALGDCISYEYSTNGTLMYITVRTGDPDLSYRVIDFIAKHLSNYIISEYGLAGGSSIVFSLVNTPVRPEEPEPSNLRTIFTALGAFAFALSGAAVIALTALLDKRVKKEDDLKNKYNAPILGTIPNFYDPELNKGEYYRYAAYKK